MKNPTTNISTRRKKLTLFTLGAMYAVSIMAGSFVMDLTTNGLINLHPLVPVICVAFFCGVIFLNLMKFKN